MKARHQFSKADQVLLKKINQAVSKQLKPDARKVRLLLWLKFAFYFSGCALLYIGLFTIENKALFVLDFIGFGLFLVLLAFNFSHDFSHDTVFKNRKWNFISFAAIYTLVGAHAQAWKKRHLESHHFAPNVEGHDSDLKISKLIRVLPHSKKYWFHRYQAFYAPIAYMSYSLFWIFIKDFVIYFSDESREDRSKIGYSISFWLQKFVYVGYLSVIPVLYSKHPWTLTLTAFLLMHFIQSLFLLLTFFMTHHVESTAYPEIDGAGNIAMSWMMNQIKSSNDMHPFSATANFILGGFNNHIAHHLFPNIHHAHYPKLNRILYEVLLCNDITPNQTSYVGGIVSHLRLLHQMGNRSAFVMRVRV
jgi:linoleoyl-CoA desaturase